MVVDVLKVPRLGHAHPVFDLGEHLLDWIEVGRIGWQKRQLCICTGDCLAHRFAAMAAKIIHDDDIAWFQCWHQELCNIGMEQMSVDRADR